MMKVSRSGMPGVFLILAWGEKGCCSIISLMRCSRKARYNYVICGLAYFFCDACQEAEYGQGLSKTCAVVVIRTHSIYLWN